MFFHRSSSRLAYSPPIGPSSFGMRSYSYHPLRLPFSRGASLFLRCFFDDLPLISFSFGTFLFSGRGLRKDSQVLAHPFLPSTMYRRPPLERPSAIPVVSPQSGAVTAGPFLCRRVDSYGGLPLHRSATTSKNTLSFPVHSQFFSLITPHDGRWQALAPADRY